MRSVYSADILTRKCEHISCRSAWHVGVTARRYDDRNMDACVNLALAQDAGGDPVAARRILRRRAHSRTTPWTDPLQPGLVFRAQW